MQHAYILMTKTILCILYVENQSPLLGNLQHLLVLIVRLTSKFIFSNLMKLCRALVFSTDICVFFYKEMFQLPLPICLFPVPLICQSIYFYFLCSSAELFDCSVVEILELTGILLNFPNIFLQFLALSKHIVTI